MIAWALRKLVSTNRSGPACCNTAFTHFLSPRLLRSGFGRLHTLFCTDLSPSRGRIAEPGDTFSTSLVCTRMVLKSISSVIA